MEVEKRTLTLRRSFMALLRVMLPIHWVFATLSALLLGSALREWDGYGLTGYLDDAIDVNAFEDGVH